MSESTNQRQALSPYSSVSNVGHGQQVARERFDGYIRLTEFDGSVELSYAIFEDETESGRHFESVSLDITLAEFDHHVQACIAKWRHVLLDFQVSRPATLWPPRRVRESCAFEDLWSHASADYVRELGAELALAGESLYLALFGGRGARAAGFTDRFLHYFSSGTRRLRVYVPANLAIEVPWGVMYTHPGQIPLDVDGRNFHWSGFWGYSHVVDQEPAGHRGSIQLRPNDERLLPVSASIDENIDAEMKSGFVTSQTTFLSQQEVLVVEYRNTKPALQAAIGASTFADRVIYFFCHATDASVNEPGLVLSDGDPVTPTDLRRWRRGRALAGNPLVLVNSCYGGRMKLNGVSAVAAELLDHGAAGVVGPCLDVPAVFADEFGRRMLGEFVSKDRITRFGGDVLGSVVRDFIDNHGNPLGLTYTLYRAAECHVEW